MNITSIAWTGFSWNPVTGCSRVSEGCRNCYAEAISLKHGWSKKPWTVQNQAENVIEHPDRLKQPRSKKEPTKIFLCSMGDLFHPFVSPTFRGRVFLEMCIADWHTYQILTKRPELAAAWPGPWPKHIWIGTSVEDRKTVGRIDYLRECPATIRFLSIEPLLEDLGPINLDGISWVVVGGESGKGYRTMDHAWARSIRDQCVAADIAFFFKQSAGYHQGKGSGLLELDGSAWVWKQFPGELTPPTCTQQPGSDALQKDQSADKPTKGEAI